MVVEPEVLEGRVPSDALVPEDEHDEVDDHREGDEGVVEQLPAPHEAATAPVEAGNWGGGHVGQSAEEGGVYAALVEDVVVDVLDPGHEVPHLVPVGGAVHLPPQLLLHLAPQRLRVRHPEVDPLQLPALPKTSSPSVPRDGGGVGKEGTLRSSRLRHLSWKNFQALKCEPEKVSSSARWRSMARQTMV